MDSWDLFEISDKKAQEFYDAIDEYALTLKLPLTDTIDVIYNIILNLAGKLVADVAYNNPDYTPQHHAENFWDTLQKVALEYFNEPDEDDEEGERLEGRTVATFKADPQPANAKVSFFGRKK